jgi:hypothetical protein
MAKKIKYMADHYDIVTSFLRLHDINYYDMLVLDKSREKMLET